MKHVIIGTAGHIDHGKTALVKALTGQDADRLPEEKQRGITIDLGYAWCDLGSIRAGFVDVPGHEKLIANMVSGVTGMDMVLFTAAADEGMMPQSYEHLDIMDILGVQRGIVVITKTDLADSDRILSVREQIKRETKGTFLENSPVILTSIRTSEGIEELRAAMAKMAEEIVRVRDSGGSGISMPRLPVDRSFSLAGFGTIVTGTLLSGTISQGDQLMVYPHEKSCRVRALQCYGEEVSEAHAGQRCALNLPKVSTEEAVRGSVIAPSGALKPTVCMNVRIRQSGYFTRALKNGMRAHLLIGTEKVICRICQLKKLSDSTWEAQLRLEEPVCALSGDRFILRFYSPLETIGGGIVLEPDSKKAGRHPKKAVEKNEKDDVLRLAELYQKEISYLMERFRESGFHFASVNAMDLSAFTEQRVRQALKQLERSGQIIRLDEYHYTTKEIAQKAQDIVEWHFEHHDELATGTLRDLLETNRTSARVLLEYLDRKKITRQKGGAATHVKGR